MYNMQDDCTKLSETDIFAGGLTWGKKTSWPFVVLCCRLNKDGGRGGDCIEIKMNGLGNNVSESC